MELSRTPPADYEAGEPRASWVMESLWIMQHIDHCFSTQFWFLCQFFTTISYSVQVTHLSLLLNWSLDLMEQLVFSYLMLLAARRELALYPPANKEKMSPCWLPGLQLPEAVCCWEQRTLPPGASDFVGIEVCCSSVPSFRGKLSG